MGPAIADPAARGTSSPTTESEIPAAFRLSTWSRCATRRPDLAIVRLSRTRNAAARADEPLCRLPGQFDLAARRRRLARQAVSIAGSSLVRPVTPRTLGGHPRRTGNQPLPVRHGRTFARRPPLPYFG